MRAQSWVNVQVVRNVLVPAANRCRPVTLYLWKASSIGTMDSRGELYRFGPFELDPEAGELKRAGLVLRLPPQPLRILFLLVSRAGEMVTREEIQQAIWGSETFVDFDHGINSAIRNIRYVLGDTAEASRYVRTTPRRGYTFIAPVERLARPGPAPANEEVEEQSPEEPVLPQAQSALRSWAIAAALIVAVVALGAIVARLHGGVFSSAAKGRDVAVLPFRWIGPPVPGLDARMFDEEVTARIAGLPARHVRIVEGDPARADVSIEGVIRSVDGNVRVIVSAIDRRSHAQLWSDTIERPADREDGIPLEVAHRTMVELARRFLPRPRYEPLLLTKVRRPALERYRQARGERRVPSSDINRIRANYEAVIREEPRFAEAWSGLSELWSVLALAGPANDQDRAAGETRRTALRALALQPRNAEALASLGVIAAQVDFNFPAAEELFRRAAAADPEYVEAHFDLAIVLAMRGRGEESLRSFTVARQLDPITYDLAPTHPLLYMHARRFEDARAHYREILAVHPESRPAQWGLMATQIALRQWDEAIRLARTIEGPSTAGPVPATAAGFLQVYRRLAPAVEQGRRDRIHNEYLVATYYAQAGDADHAFEALERAVAIRSPLLGYLRVDPRLDNLRRDARFTRLLVKSRLMPAAAPQLAAR